MKTLRCGEIMEGCAHQIEGATEQDVLNQAGRHAVDAHGLTVTPEVVALVKDHIRDETPSAG